MSQMDRHEAVLRELNLYPLWVRRVSPEPAEPAVEATFSVSGRPENHSSHSNAPSKAEGRVTVDSVTVQECAAPAAATEREGDQSRDQSIGELDWPHLRALVRDCADCKLRAGCTQTVFGVGDEQADWLFVGEGPGADEDAQGEPFVGQAGTLLDNMLMSINLRRGKNVYIANIVKCRPPNNRTPEFDEVAACLPYLKHQIELMKPRLIVALGKTASTALLGKDAPPSSLRGRLHEYNGIPLVVTYHPAYLLRSPLEKAKAWKDLCMAVEAIAGQ
jgi:DNA polymerase